MVCVCMCVCGVFFCVCVCEMPRLRTVVCMLSVCYICWGDVVVVVVVVVVWKLGQAFNRWVETL